MSAPILPTTNNRIMVATIAALGRSQRRTPGFNRERALTIAASIEASLLPNTTAEGIYALCGLLLRGLGIRDAGELAELLSD